MRGKNKKINTKVVAIQNEIIISVMLRKQSKTR